MAEEEPKSPTPEKPPAAPEQTPSSDAPESPPTSLKDGEAAAPAAGGATLQPDALSDGTVPTVLAPGAKSDNKNATTGQKIRGSLGSLYRRADIVTTLITFVVALIAAGLVLGTYLYLTRSKNKPAGTPKVTTLSQSDLSKLGTFFGGTGGGSTDVLTISSSTLFKNRLAVDNDIKVTGGLDVAGSTTLADLTVNKTSTLGVTNVRGALNVSGPLNLQSPASLNGGISAKGDISGTGNGTFGGSVSAGLVNTSTLAVTGNINLGGHIVITGPSPSASGGSEIGSGGSVIIDGNDSAGTVVINTGNTTNAALVGGGLLANITFKNAYTHVPRVLITPVGSPSGALPFYVQRTAAGFTIGAASGIHPSSNYSFDYWIVQ